MREELGWRVRALRESLDLSIERMAYAASVHPKYLGALERGAHTAGVWTVVKVAWGAGVDPAPLIAGLRPLVDHPIRPAPT